MRITSAMNQSPRPSKVWDDDLTYDFRDDGEYKQQRDTVEAFFNDATSPVSYREIINATGCREDWVCDIVESLHIEEVSTYPISRFAKQTRTCKDIRVTDMNGRVGFSLYKPESEFKPHLLGKRD